MTAHQFGVTPSEIMTSRETQEYYKGLRGRSGQTFNHLYNKVTG